MDTLEYRNYSTSLKSEDGRYIEGYGSVFNSRSHDLGGFTEIIAPGAFDGVIEKSDVKCYLNHDSSRGILARSRNGEGSLHLSIDERGLKYEFEAPNTTLGDEVVEGLKRGDYDESSFAFTVEDETWTREEGGTYLRTINKIKMLYDVSIVPNGAYSDTSVALRSLEAFKAQEVPVQEEVKEEVREEAPESPVQETPVDETPVEEKEPEVQETEPKEERNNISNTKNIHMSKFSLIKSINDVVNNRNINEDALSVIEMGATEMRKSGLSYSGQIQLPVEERGNAIAATVTNDGAEIVETEKLNILEPLRGKSILGEIGTTFLTGLVGNISIPTYSGSTCGWKGDSVGAEEMLRRDIVNALIAKLEQTIFGSDAGDNTKPEGIFVNAEDMVPSWGAVCDAEADVNDFSGEKRWVVSPTAKSTFKQTTVSGQLSDLRMIMEGNEINGYPVSCSSNVGANGGGAVAAFGDFHELVVAQWGAIDIVVDPYTLATKNAIRLVINAYFDAKVRRDGAIKPYALKDE